MSTTWLLVSVCGAVAAASLVGGWVSLKTGLRPAPRRLWLGFVAGLLLGLSLLHLVPHALEELANPHGVMYGTVAGFLTLFLLLRVFPCPAAPDRESSGDHHSAGSCQARGHASWWGGLVGLSLHSLLDGFALATAVLSARLHGLGAAAGLLLAVLVHKPLDALALITLMRRAGVPPRRLRAFNWGFAAVAPAGVLIWTLGPPALTHGTHAWEGIALAFCAGVFLCIAACELLPELPFHARPRWDLWGAFAAGVVLTSLPVWFEHGGNEHLPHVHPLPCASATAGLDKTPLETPALQGWVIGQVPRLAAGATTARVCAPIERSRVTAYQNYALGEDDAAVRHLRLARLIWQRDQNRSAGPEQRASLTSFEALQREIPGRVYAGGTSISSRLAERLPQRAAAGLGAAAMTTVPPASAPTPESLTMQVTSLLGPSPEGKAPESLGLTRGRLLAAALGTLLVANSYQVQWLLSPAPEIVAANALLGALLLSAPLLHNSYRSLARGEYGINELVSLAILAALGHINPIIAAILHNAGSLLVVFNSARLVRSGESLEPAFASASPVEIPLRPRLAA